MRNAKATKDGAHNYCWSCSGHSGSTAKYNVEKKVLIVSLQVRIVSAHQTPELMFTYASSAQEWGVQIIIAGAAHWPVIGAPVRGSSLDGMDSLLSIVKNEPVSSGHQG